MAIVKTDSIHYTNIATKIREKTGGDETYTPSEMADGVEKAYDAGRNKELDAFWGRYLHNGERPAIWAGQAGIFYGANFGFSNFYPTLDIRPVGDASYLFYAWQDGKNYGYDHSGSLAQRLKECGVVFDTSKATKLSNAFSYTYITEIPTIDCTGLVGDSTSVFAHGYSRISTIEKIIVTESTTFSNWFANTCVADITFEGVIGQDLSITYGGGIKRLSVDSMKNIISCLKNYNGTDDEFVHTLTFHESYWAALEADSTAPDGGTWREYVGSLGWNT